MVKFIWRLLKNKKIFTISTITCILLENKPFKIKKVMETFYFVFGVLSVVCLIFMTLIILGTVKIKKLSNSIENNQKDLDNLYREVDQRERTIRRILEDHSRDVTMVERTLISKIERDCGDTKSYVDSRIDKSLSNISKDK